MANTFSSLLDMVYPTGSIFMSMKKTSPVTLFGGQWSNIYDSAVPNRCLIPVSTGTTFTVNKSNNPTHQHQYGAAFRLYYSAVAMSGQDQDIIFFANFNPDNSLKEFRNDNTTVVENNLKSWTNGGVATSRKQVQTWDNQILAKTDYQVAIPPHTNCYAWNRTS